MTQKPTLTDAVNYALALVGERRISNAASDENEHTVRVMSLYRPALRRAQSANEWTELQSRLVVPGLPVAGGVDSDPGWSPYLLPGDFLRWSRLPPVEFRMRNGCVHLEDGASMEAWYTRYSEDPSEWSAGLWDVVGFAAAASLGGSMSQKHDISGMMEQRFEAALHRWSIDQAQQGSHAQYLPRRTGWGRAYR